MIKLKYRTMIKLKYPTRSTQCSTCIFRDNNVVTTARLDEIRTYLSNGTTHICHTSKDKACRGGRKYQAQIWHRLGYIKHATIKALDKAVLKALNKKP